MAIKIGNVPFLNYDEIKNFIENKLDQKHLYELIRSQFLDILSKCIQMIVVNTEEPIIPIQINSYQFLSIMNILQVKYIAYINTYYLIYLYNINNIMLCEQETYVKNKSPFLIILSKRQPSNIQIIIHILYVNILKKSTSELR